jgi:hypothetical protein
VSVDVGFELSYILSDVLGRSVRVEDYSYDPGKGVLCVVAVVNGVRSKACIEVRQCKSIQNPNKRWKCVLRALAEREELLRSLAERLTGSTG